jgi:DNA-binding MarR family transcriptional regulator
MAETRWLDEREAHVWREFLAMSKRLLSQLGTDLQRATGLSAADYEVLVNLSEAADGRLRPSELGAAIRWEKSRLSHQVSRMEQRGLVKRSACKTDARGAFVAITAAGRRAIEKAAPEHVEQVRRVFFDALDPAQRDALLEICEAVSRQLEQCPTDDAFGATPDC